MSDTDHDDLHDLLAGMAAGGDAEPDELPLAPEEVTPDTVELAAELAAAGPSSGMAPQSPLPAETGASTPLKLIFALALLVVGALLLAWAVYGLLILTGTVTVDRDNARSMAKLMAFAAGPIGAILSTAGTMTLRRWFRTRARPAQV